MAIVFDTADFDARDRADATCTAMQENSAPSNVVLVLQHGWLENPSVPQFSVARYTRYSDLLHHWAARADTTAELVEMWLTHHWRTQIADADRVRRGHRNIT